MYYGTNTHKHKLLYILLHMGNVQLHARAFYVYYYRCCLHRNYLVVFSNITRIGLRWKGVTIRAHIFCENLCLGSYTFPQIYYTYMCTITTLKNYG